MPRLFLAISLPEPIRTSLSEMGADAIEGLRPAKRDQMHLTLRFLGETEVDPVAKALENLASCEPFSLSVAGVGTFGGSRNPSVLWAGVEPCPALQHLHRTIERSMSEAGFPQASLAFHPHITLGRLRRKPGQAPRVRKEKAAAISAFLKHHANLSLAPFPVSSFELYASEPAGEGVHYRLIRSFSLEF